MNILYGVSGHGFGHSSRAMIIAKFLEKKGHLVKILTHGQAYDILHNKFDVVKINGLHIACKKGKVSNIHTFFTNIKPVLKNLYKISTYQNLIKKFKPNICISDFEPLTSRLAFINRIPLISIDNLHILTGFKLNAPLGHKKNFFLSKRIVDFITPHANQYVVTTFFDLEERKKNYLTVPPIIRGNIRKIKPSKKSKIIVYLTHKNPQTIRLLKKINEKFLVYGYNINKKEGNIEFRTKDSFEKEFGACKAVIATAGFSMISEAIYLNKSFFAMPIKKQFEQTLNGIMIKKRGFGDYSENPTKKKIESFLTNLKEYESNLKNYTPDYDKIFKKLEHLLDKYS